MIRSCLAKLILAHRRRKYRPGLRFRRFVGCDFLVEIEVVDASRIGEGVLIIRSRGLSVMVRESERPVPGPFSTPREVSAAKLWDFDTYVYPVS